MFSWEHSGFHLACRLRRHLSGTPSPRRPLFYCQHPTRPRPCLPPAWAAPGRVFICEQTPRTQIALICGEFTLYFPRNCPKCSNVASSVTFLPTGKGLRSSRLHEQCYWFSLQAWEAIPDSGVVISLVLSGAELVQLGSPLPYTGPAPRALVRPGACFVRWLSEARVSC